MIQHAFLLFLSIQAQNPNEDGVEFANRSETDKVENTNETR